MTRTIIQLPASADPSAEQSYRFWGKTKPNSDVRCLAVTRTSEDATRATIRMYGPVDPWGGFWGVSAKEVAEALDALDDTVTEIQLRVNSPGGSVFEGIGILNLLRAHPARVVAVVDGLAASAASFIAAGCDETVMSPGTQMMIHDPESSAWGCSAAEMREAADTLDKIGESMASLYADAAGGTAQSWRAAMLEETWYTAEEAVEAGLAQRVAVVEDAGQAVTAGGDPEETDPDLGEFEDSFDLSLFNYAGRTAAPGPHSVAAAAATSQIPSASAAGSTPTHEGSAPVAFTTEQLTTMRRNLGLPETADEATIVAALSEALAEQAEAPTASAPPVPDGMSLVETAVLDQLRTQAELGAEARAQQLAERREQLVTAAVNDGRIPPARRDHWLSQLEADPGAEATLAALAPGLVPVAELGHAGDDKAITDADATYAALFGPDTKES